MRHNVDAATWVKRQPYSVLLRVRNVMLEGTAVRQAFVHHVQLANTKMAKVNILAKNVKLTRIWKTRASRQRLTASNVMLSVPLDLSSVPRQLLHVYASVLTFINWTTASVLCVPRELTAINVMGYH
jgi:hypothetical protein